MQAEVGTIKALFARKEQKQEQEHWEKLIQAVSTAKKQEVRAQRSIDAKRHRHQVSAEELKIFIARMAENSRPGQLVNNAFIATKAIRSSVDDHDEASTPRIETRQILTNSETSKAFQSGSFVSPPDNRITHKHREQQIPGSDDSAGCGVCGSRETSKS